MQINLVLLFILLAAGLWTVMTRSLLRAAIGLAFTSVILTIIMFRLNARLAAMFELSVCAGLIPVLFISVISLTQPLTKQEILQHMKQRLARFWFLPLLLVVIGIALILMRINPITKLPAAETVKDARNVIWNLRQLDLLGQVIILLTGAFAVVILFKERVKK